MVEYVDDWSTRMVEVGPGQLKLSHVEPWQRGKEQRVVEKRLSVSEILDMHDQITKAVNYIARTFR